MLSELKDAIAIENLERATNNFILESAESSDVRDMFLDDVDVYVGSDEEDKDIKTLVDKIPEYKNQIPTEKIDELTESLVDKIPQTVLKEEYEITSYLMIGNAQFADWIYDNKKEGNKDE